ncbi:MAG: hypothetical protein LBQ54_09615 [Planctomycetaceae bacterium]|jgi:hypothetical protein|nr:hypothetical protein [Planctomycetaceae bacterium]
MKQYLFPPSLLLLLLIPFCGCTREVPDGMPATVPCFITVTQDGKPLAEASITLIPEDGGQWNGGGKTDAGGTARMYTQAKYEGIPAAKYKVIVAKTEFVAGVPESSDHRIKGTPDIYYELVEAKYANAETTPLTLDVVKGTKNYQIDIGQSVRIKVEER